MKFLLINPPHPAIGSRIPREHLPPLGLLSIGGPLLDHGHHVKLLDAEFGPMRLETLIQETLAYRPDCVLIGHSGSTSAHPVVSRIAQALRGSLPDLWIVYGGVFPTYHWTEILELEPAIDVIVRGEGEETMVRLAEALGSSKELRMIAGLAFRAGTRSGPRRTELLEPWTGEIVSTGAAPVIRDLDACRVGWELIDHARYTYYGKRRAVVVQFSRGCPHRCTYCGQHGFWRAWRHRDPVRFAREIARLHREHGVELFNLADENPTALATAWREFLEALIAENVNVVIIGTTRASDIVRDAGILHLYRKAGVARFLLGLESTNDTTLEAIRKGSTTAVDREAIRLMREHGIISMAAWVAGFAQETDADYWRTLRQLLSYDPDQIQALYATPHRWTRFAIQEANARVVQLDLSKWDYKHQVMESTRVPNWRVLLWVKSIEAVCQLRPKALYRLLVHQDPLFRAGMRWYSNIGKRVWSHEIWQWLFHDRLETHGPALAGYLRGGWKRGWQPLPASGVREDVVFPLLDASARPAEPTTGHSARPTR